MTKYIGFKFNIIRFVIFIIGFIILWICGHFLLSSFIWNNDFIFTVAGDILTPLILSIPVSAFTQLIQAE